MTKTTTHEFLRCSHHDLHLRSETLVLLRLDFLRLVVGATVAGDEIREKRFSGGEFAGETVVEYSLSIKSQESKRSLPFAENLGGYHLLVYNSKMNRRRRRRKKEKKKIGKMGC